MDSLLLGLTLGAAAGISPGPLLVLVITSAIRGGWPAGVLAACAPLISDVVVVAGTLLVLGQLPGQALGYVALSGSLFILWTGVTTIRESGAATLTPDAGEQRRAARQALGRAALMNLLSPHPWISWATVLGPLTLATWDDSQPAAIALVVAFYIAIVGAKALIAVVMAGQRHRLGDVGYRRALVAAGVLLLVAAVALAVEFAPVAFA